MAITASAVPAGFVDLALEGCTVVVTGAGSGIGAATARLLGAAKSGVVVHDGAVIPVDWGQVIPHA